MFLDWLKLRKDYRIIGEFIGCLPKKPRQDIFLGLPLLLQPEEVSLLLEKKIARLIQYSCFQKAPSDSLKQIFEEYRNILYAEQEKCLRRERQKQVIKKIFLKNIIVFLYVYKCIKNILIIYAYIIIGNWYDG